MSRKLLFVVFLISAVSAQTTYRLSYFNANGRAEFIRQMFLITNTPYIDDRIEFSNWQGVRATFPFRQVPVLDVIQNGVTTRIGQSMAIASYLGRQLGLSGQTELERALVHMYGELAGDLFDDVNSPSFETNRAIRDQEIDKLINEVWPNYLSLFETRLIQNGRNGHLVGNRITWADLYLSHTLSYLFRRRHEVLMRYPNVAFLDVIVRNNEIISRWIARRPVSDF